MKTCKHLIFTILSLAAAMAACTTADDAIEENPGGIIPAPEEGDPINLSAEEMANCYVVQSAGVYRFKADNQFNLGPGLPIPPEISAKEATLVWQTHKQTVTNLSLVNDNGTPYVEFEITKPAGSALVAVTDENGTIQWSWHIWMPSENIEAIPASSGYEIMNLNLGAEVSTPGNARSYGFLYQWGRKDPLPASATPTGDTSTTGRKLYDIDGNEVKITNSSWYKTDDNTLEYAISHPTVCLSNQAQYSQSRDWLRQGLSDDTLWGNPENGSVGGGKGSKTCYDPSPAGWHVAPPDAFNHFTTSGGYAWTFDDFAVADYNNDGDINLDDYNFGWHFLISPQSAVYFPAATRYEGSYAMLMGSMSGYWGNYWSNASATSIAGGARCALAFQVKDISGNEAISVSPSAVSSRADAFSIRCIRDN